MTTQFPIELMFDIEVLGMRGMIPRGASPEIVEIGVVAFRGAEVVDELVLFPVEGNGACDANTVRWWLDLVRKGMDPVWMARRESGATDSVKECLLMLKTFCNRHDPKFVWGNDPEMDLSPLENWFHQIGVVCPWNFYQRMDVRTLRNDAGLKAPNPVGKHGALVDARAQVDLLAGIRGQRGEVRKQEEDKPRMDANGRESGGEVLTGLQDGAGYCARCMSWPCACDEGKFDPGRGLA